MPDRQHQRELFADKRARALTMMVLTRHEKLHIEEVHEGVGLDYIVRFHTEGKEGLREFGVALHAVRTAMAKEQADRLLRPSLRQLKRYGPFPHPVCLFVFTMEDDGAWYTWAAEPAIDDGQPVLRWDGDVDCEPLDKRALNGIIGRVDEWYDKLFARLVVNRPALNAR
jgi:hypothetical protein